VPLALTALALAWRGLRRRTIAIGVVVAVALLLEGVLPAVRPSADFTAAVAREAIALAERLGQVAEDAGLRHLLSTGGGEAEPEALFRLVAERAQWLPARPDALAVADDHGVPVAWTDGTKNLPVNMRLLGGRAIVAEPGVGSVWIWWREGVLEEGRLVGSLIAGVRLAEAGERRVLSVWAGRNGVAVPRVEAVGLTTFALPLGLAFALQRSSPLPWSAPGAAVVLVLALLLLRRPRAILGLAAVVIVTATAAGWLPRGWWLVVAIAVVAFVLSVLPRGWLLRAAGAGIAAALVAGLPRLLQLVQLRPVPENLLWPGTLVWALVACMALLLRAAAGRRTRARPLWLRMLCFAPLVLGAVEANPPLLGLGAAAVVLGGLAGRGLLLPALTAAAAIFGADNAMRKDALMADTEATIARLGRAEAPARALLASLPEQGLGEFVRLEEWPRMVVLGRIAGWLGFDQALPGASLVLVDPMGEVQAAWGGATGRLRSPPLATRAVRAGWQLAVVTPEWPHDLLAALAEAGVDAPLAVYDRSGAVAAHGANFRPLSPAHVGQALATGPGWGSIGVADREFLAYLRPVRDSVLAVPWVRPPLADAGLLLAALALWGTLPVALWERRRRWRKEWRQRRTFTGRVRVLSVVAAVLPLVLAGQLLPEQWNRQQAQARRELGRAISQLAATPAGGEELGSLVHERGGTLAIYRAGRLASATRPDLAVRNVLPWLPPVEAYVRAVRGWREPLVRGEGELDVFAPVRGDVPTVIGVVGVPLGTLGGHPTPAEWFVFTVVFAAVIVLGTTERLGRRLTRPLRRLLGASRRLERGERLERLATGGDEDVQALGRAFVTMAHEVQRRQEDLRRERDVLDTILSTLSAAVVVIDARNTVVLANPAAQRLFGPAQRLEEFAGRFAPNLAAIVTHAAGGGASSDVAVPVGLPEQLWRATALPLAGSEARALLVMEDLSEVARAERLASLAELARIAAHEVKNPLTPIRLWAEELRAAVARGPGDAVAVAQVAAQQILERVEHLREVAQGFSNLVALEHWEPRRIELGELAREVVSEYAVLGQRGVAVVQTGSGAAIEADPDWIRRAVRHLLENSARVVARDGTIAVDVSRDGEQAVLSVRDSGGGVPPEQLRRLFEPHFSTTSEGSGLGLAVVQRVATRAGGRAEARNTERGLEVRLVFPACGT
jgi:signal transduction histidine kinase